MTAISGFQCADGILLCADSEQTTSNTTKSQVGKIRVFRLRDTTLALAGAGDGALIDFVIEDLIRQQLAGTSLDLNALGDFIDRYARRLFREHIRPYAGFAPDFIPDVAFLVAAELGGRSRLFRWERNFAYAVPPMTHTSIGIGTIQSEQLINEQQFFFPAEQMLFYAVRLMQKVKQLVQGCGGKTEVVLLRNDGTMVRYGTVTLDAIERLSEEIDNFFLEQVLAFTSNSSSISEESIGLRIEALRRAIREFRERYMQLIPFTTFDIPPESG